MTKEEILKELLADVLLVAEMYSIDYPFDDNHRKKHTNLFFRAHYALGSTIEQIKQCTGLDLGKV
jgi:hypothetical protein